MSEEEPDKVYFDLRQNIVDHGSYLAMQETRSMTQTSEANKNSAFANVVKMLEKKACDPLHPLTLVRTNITPCLDWTHWFTFGNL